MPRQAWEKIPGEPDHAYRYFLVYRNLGPRRTRSKAYTVYQKQVKKISEAQTGILQVSGQWNVYYRDFEWRRRATLWDIYNLQVFGAQTGVFHLMTLFKIAKHCYEKSCTLKPGDPAWPDLVMAVKELGKTFDKIAQEPRQFIESSADDADAITAGDARPDDAQPAGAEAESPAALPGHDPDGAAGPPGRTPEVEDDDGVT